MASNERGIDLRATALGHRDGNIIAVASYIETVQDLQGRTIAIPNTMSTHNILLNQLLASNNMSVDDVIVVQLPPTEMVAALAGGSISAYVVAEPFGARAVTSNVGKNFAESHEIWENSICCAMVFSNDFIEANLELVTEFMRRYHEAGAFLEENTNPLTEQIIDIASRHLVVDDATLELSMQWISFDNLDITEQEYAALYEYMIMWGLSQSPPSFSEFVLYSLGN
jgi:NitT/TauT family transport system substrate-binding protein